MKEVKLVFHNAKEERPTESGYYLCLSGDLFQHMKYSKKWDMFNSHDSYVTKKEAQRNKIDVDFWADITYVLKEMKGTET